MTDIEAEPQEVVVNGKDQQAFADFFKSLPQVREIYASGSPSGRLHASSAEIGSQKCDPFVSSRILRPFAFSIAR